MTTMPPRPRHLLLGLGITLSIACASPVRSTAPPEPKPAPPAADSAGAWQAADRWVFEWTSGNDSGTKTAEVLEVKEVNGLRYYAMKIAEVQHYYTPDLHWAATIRGGRVEARMLPPQPWFMWPLTVGRRWAHEGKFEDLRGPRVQHSRFTVTSVETVEVPAGRFQAFHVIRETDVRGDTDEYWYAPAVQWYVRWVGRRGDLEFEERLREYWPAGRLPAPPGAPGQ